MSTLGKATSKLPLFIFLTPILLWLFLLIVLPHIDLLRMSFRIENDYGDMVWSVNNYEWVVAQFATARIGAVLVNVNPAYRVHEFEYVLKESRARAIVLIESFKSSNYLDMLYEVCPELAQSEPGNIESWRFPHLKSAIFIGSTQHRGMFTRRAFAELGVHLDLARMAPKDPRARWVCWAGIGWGELLDDAVIKHGDSVRHSHCFTLIVGYVDHGHI